MTEDMTTKKLFELESNVESFDAFFAYNKQMQSIGFQWPQEQKNIFKRNMEHLKKGYRKAKKELKEFKEKIQ